MSVPGVEPRVYAGRRRWRGAASLGVAALALAGCATRPLRCRYSHGHEHFAQSKYGHASPKVVADGQPVPAGRRAISGRPSLYRRRAQVLSRGRPVIFGGRHGLLVRRRVPWPPHRQRRSLRHGLAFGRPSDDAAAELRAGDQSRQRLFGHRPRQRSRSLSRRAGDGRFVAGRRGPRHEGDGHGAGESRVCRTGADGRVGRFAIAGEPAHRRIASQYDRLSGPGDGGGGGDPDDLLVLFRPRRAADRPAAARPVQVASRPAPAPEPEPEPVRVAAVAEAPAAETAPTPEAAPVAIRQPHGAVPLPPSRPFDLGSNRSNLVVAAVATSLQPSASSCRRADPISRPARKKRSTSPSPLDPSAKSRRRVSIGSSR